MDCLESHLEFMLRRMGRALTRVQGMRMVTIIVIMVWEYSLKSRETQIA